MININHFHGSNQKSKDEHVYSLLTDPKESTDDDHDYDEPYFEPADTEETLLAQLKSLGVPMLAKDTLK